MPRDRAVYARGRRPRRPDSLQVAGAGCATVLVLLGWLALIGYALGWWP